MVIQDILPNDNAWKRHQLLADAFKPALRPTTFTTIRSTDMPKMHLLLP